MSKIYFSQFAVDEIRYFADFIEDNIADYELKELSNGYMGDIPNIILSHPLAAEYGALLSASDPRNYTSVLPAIGVELLNDNESGKQLLGQGYKSEEITQAFITQAASIDMKDRYKEGLLMSDTVNDALQSAKTAKAGEKLWAVTKQYFQDQSVNISMWSDQPEVTRLLYLTMKSLLKRTKLDIAKNYSVKNLSISGQTALYNYEFGGTRYGAEFNLTFVNSHKDVEVDDSLLTLTEVEHYLNTTGKVGPDFVPLGEGTNP